MTLSTSFTLEELDYLNSLPTKEAPDGATHIENREVCWSRARQAQWHAGAEECAGRDCDVWCHFHAGWVYVRHGEMLAKAPLSEDRGAAQEFTPWFDAIHAHEAAGVS